MKKWIKVIIIAFGAFVSISTASAAKTEGGAVERAIRERIGVLEKLWAKGDAAGIAREVYGKDVIIQGEGQAETINTAAAAEAVIRHLVADSSGVKLDIYNVRPLAEDAALSWVTWNVTPKAAGEKPFKVKALFVWSKGADGWRIRADMYVMGAM